MAKLFIVGFPKDMQEIELVELFSQHGIVNTVTIVTDMQTGESKGYGFITMTDDAGAQRAIDALNGASIDDRTISVRFAEEKNVAKPVSNPPFKKHFANKPTTTRRDSQPGTPKPKRPRRSS
ncbi:RNA recognition motif domain-containing protein [Mucilaginibacter paludis]|uniref:RNP-1 like RNA-binding protein n=1 Tax=Mucilaginibacter paludis DSM 18603 TaxID=714943 RepID=H1YCS4_9SPHI|nr:RNP-1 like RNA-binding protein [Mucilaginibacter paludis]EHQ24261.1 RNP-1 like RNA-binding protein [Mucilaginibacter paludis DSM 18603]